jgi:hypothetical protein
MSCQVKNLFARISTKGAIKRLVCLERIPRRDCCSCAERSAIEKDTFCCKMGWKDLEPESKIPTFQLIEWSHLDVVRRLTPSKNGNHEIHTTPQLEHPTLPSPTNLGTQLEHPNLHKLQHQHNCQPSIQKQHQHHPLHPFHHLLQLKFHLHPPLHITSSPRLNLPQLKHFSPPTGEFLYHS